MQTDSRLRPLVAGCITTLLLTVSLGLAGCQSAPSRDGAQDAMSPAVPSTGKMADVRGGGDLLVMRKEAEQLYRAKDFAKALPLYENLSRRAPKDALTWFYLGNVQARLQQNDQAIKSYERAVQYDPGLSKAWHNMGLLQLRQSANSFTQMAQLTKSGDPLSGRAIHLSQGTLALLDKGPANATPAGD